jgi:hypothetical protein
MIFFSRSTDHGVHWSKAIQISPASQNEGVQGSQVAVGPKCEVYVSYEVFFTTGSQHLIAKSTNGVCVVRRAGRHDPRVHRLDLLPRLSLQ